jgi:hypothetical protein
MRSLLACGLLGLLPTLGSADSFDDLRLRWRQMLIGGTSLDTTIPQVRSALASVNSTGKRYWSSLQTATSRQSLWTDIAAPYTNPRGLHPWSLTGSVLTQH